MNNVEDTTPETKSVIAVPIVQQLSLLAIVLLLIFSVGYLPKLLSQSSETAAVNNIPVKNTENIQNITPEAPSVPPFADLTIQAEAVFVFDVAKQRVLYEKNPDEQLPLASITKLMTTLVASELITEKTTIPITTAAINQDGSSGLLNGESFTLESLSDLTLISSSNDGAFALAATAGALLDTENAPAAFVNAMNIRADELGLTQTYYRNPTGLDISETEAGAFGSARDVTFLMEYIITERPTLLERTTNPTAAFYNTDGSYHTAENTNHAIRNIAGLIGSKTGYTELAGGNLTIAFDAAPNRPIVIAVLGSTRSARFSDVVALSSAARAAIK